MIVCLDSRNCLSVHCHSNIVFCSRVLACYLKPFTFVCIKKHAPGVKTSLPTRHRQAGTRQGLACWREFECLEKAKDRKTSAKKSYASSLERSCARIVATHRTRSTMVQSSRGSRSGRVQSKEHFIMESMTLPGRKKIRGKEEQRKTRRNRIRGKKERKTRPVK